MYRLGQHFLKSRAALERIARALDITHGETVIEVGGGHGELTALLHDALSKQKGSLITIEKDAALAEHLTSAFKDRGGADTRVVHGDALRTLPDLADALAGTAWKLAGNIPYYITGHLFRTIGSLRYKPARAVLTIQKEVALRLLQRAPRANRFALSVAPWATPQMLFTIARNEFSPPPRVDSAVVTLEIKPWSLPARPENYYAMLRLLFMHPRKTLGNNLAYGFKKDRGEIASLLATLGLSPSLRPHNINEDAVAALAFSLLESGG